MFIPRIIFSVRSFSFFTILFLYSTLANSALRAQGAEFLTNFPVSCTPGENCWLIDLFDHGPGDAGGVQDFQCGKLATPQSRQTVIGTGRSFAENSVFPPVVAAAAGKVRFVKNTENDDGSGADPDGNTVQIEHPNGYITIYIYLKKDSILVKQGDTVAGGQAIARAGQSGRAREISLGFRVFSDKQDAVDPFRGKCGTTGLWRANQAQYPERFALLDTGISAERPQNSHRDPEITSSTAGKEIFLFIKTMSAAKTDRFEVSLCALKEGGQTSDICFPVKTWQPSDNEGYKYQTISWDLSGDFSAIPGIWRMKLSRNGAELKAWTFTIWKQ